MVTASRSAIEQEDATPSKWKSEEERCNVVAPAASSEMASMVRAWQNPNFRYVTEVPAAVATTTSKKSRVFNTGAVQFKRSMFRGLSVIGQVDKKFIAATMPNDDDGRNGSSRLLVLFDQHAVHERIRLEALIKGQLWIMVDNTLNTLEWTKSRDHAILGLLLSFSKNHAG